MTWQPIETAPRDGTPILAWEGKEQLVVKYHVRKDGSCFWITDESPNGMITAAANVLLNWQALGEPPEGWRK